MRGCSVAVDRRLSGRRFPRVPRMAPGQQSLFDDREAPQVNENAWKLTEAHRQAGRAGVAQARETAGVIPTKGRGRRSGNVPAENLRGSGLA